jgi:transposase-like protein
LGCTSEALRRWVRQAERDRGERPDLTTDERAELKRLQREVFELKRANEILRKAAAFFAPSSRPSAAAMTPATTRWPNRSSVSTKRR